MQYITAASDSLDPINFAGAVARKRGTVVVVGAVPTGYDREPHFYKKELTVRMSCSYGPGRYDPEYEEKGRDYPVGYVRWTEKRNMEAFQALLASGKIDLSFLTTHVFKLEDAPKAYDLILGKKEPFLRILIEYDREKRQNGLLTRIDLQPAGRSPDGKVRIAFIGAGSYAQSHLLPNLKGLPDLILQGVMTTTPASARSVAERFGNVYGPLSSHKSSLVAKFINQALTGEVCQIYGDGAQTRDFIYITDLIDAIWLAALNPGIGGEVFQIASGREHTVNEVAELLKDYLETSHGIDMTMTYSDPRKGDVRRNYSNTTKARKCLNWNAEVDLERGLSQTVAWFLSRTQGEGRRE